MLPTYRVSSATSRLCSLMKAVIPASPSLSLAVATYPLQIVLSQPQATDPDAVARRPPAFRVTVLIDVAVHHVEVARFLRELMQRIPHPVAHPVPHASRPEVALGQPGVSGSPSVQTTSPSGPTARANQYAESRIPTRVPSPGERQRLAQRARGSARSPSRRSGPVLSGPRLHLDQNRLLCSVLAIGQIASTALSIHGLTLDKGPEDQAFARLRPARSRANHLVERPGQAEVRRKRGLEMGDLQSRSPARPTTTTPTTCRRAVIGSRTYFPHAGCRFAGTGTIRTIRLRSSLVAVKKRCTAAVPRTRRQGGVPHPRVVELVSAMSASTSSRRPRRIGQQLTFLGPPGGGAGGSGGRGCVHRRAGTPRRW